MFRWLWRASATQNQTRGTGALFTELMSTLDILWISCRSLKGLISCQIRFQTVSRSFHRWRSTLKMLLAEFAARMSGFLWNTRLKSLIVISVNKVIVYNDWYWPSASRRFEIFGSLRNFTQWNYFSEREVPCWLTMKGSCSSWILRTSFQNLVLFGDKMQPYFCWIETWTY